MFWSSRAEVSAGLRFFWSLQKRICSLSFPVSRVHLHSLACDPFFQSLQPWFPLTHEPSCSPLIRTLLITSNPLEKSSIISPLKDPQLNHTWQSFFAMKGSIHRFWGLEHEHLWRTTLYYWSKLLNLLKVHFSALKKRVGAQIIPNILGHYGGEMRL